MSGCVALSSRAADIMETFKSLRKLSVKNLRALTWQARLPAYRFSAHKIETLNPIKI